MRKRKRKAASSRLPCPRQDASPCQPRAGVMAILFGFRSVGEENPAGRGQVHGGGAEDHRGARVQAGLTLPREMWGTQGMGGCHFLAAVMKLFSMQRTTKACWQLLAICSSSLPEPSEEAWPVTACSSVRHVSQ